jgi:acetyl-CoA carboxylase biotin carboxyl carrier protein
MNLRQIKALIDTAIEKDIAELEFEKGDEKLRIRRFPRSGPQDSPNSPPYVVVASAPPSIAEAAQPPPVALPSNPVSKETPPPAPSTYESAEEEDLVMVTAPIVGTFFEAPSPDAPPFVEVGDKVQTGQVLCIIEAMKLMNEIPSDADGEIAEIYVNNGEPVEYNQALFGIRPTG